MTMTSLMDAAALSPAWTNDFGPDPFFFLIPLFWTLLFVALAIVFVTRRRRGFGPGGWREQVWQASQGSRNAEATLAERFAQGDIEEVEYRARLEVLRANRASGDPRR